MMAYTYMISAVLAHLHVLPVQLYLSLPEHPPTYGTHQVGIEGYVRQ